jgi:hypothetical protein
VKDTPTAYVIVVESLLIRIRDYVLPVAKPMEKIFMESVALTLIGKRTTIEYLEVLPMGDTYRRGAIPGFNGRYMVDTDGNVWSMYSFANRWKVRMNKPKILSPMVNRSGYKIVSLFDSQKRSKKYLVHRLVATVFIENPENKRCVCHKDNNPLNCAVSNLYWGTDSENRTQAYDDWLHTNTCPVAKLNMNGEVVAVYKNQRRAAIKNGIPSPNINNCVNGKRRKKTKNVKWKRITREEYELFVALNGGEE